MPSDLNKYIYPRSWEMEVRKDPSLYMVHIINFLGGFLNKYIYPQSWEMEVRKDPSLFMVHISINFLGGIFFLVGYYYSVIA